MEDLSKGYDASPPQNGIIFGVAVFTIVLLLAIKFLLDSYFGAVMDAEYHDKVAVRGLEPVRSMRAKEAETMGKMAMPMDQATKALSERGRAASPMIAPKSGQGMEQVAGWTQLKREPAAAPAPTPAPAAPSGAAPAAPQGATH